MSHRKQGYTSEISQQWQRLKWVLPKRKRAGRPVELEMRAVVNAIVYRLGTGYQWPNLPHEDPNHQGVYYHYQKWCLGGTWQRINRTMGYRERRRMGCFPRPSTAIVDSQSVKGSDTGGRATMMATKRLKAASGTSW